MSRFRIEYGSEWPFEWTKYYQSINVFQIYYNNDGEGIGITFFLFNWWICFKLRHKNYNP